MEEWGERTPRVLLHATVRAGRRSRAPERSGMRNADRWVASKFVLRNDTLATSPDVTELAVGSRLVAGLVAKNYEQGIREYARGRLLDVGCGKAPLYGFYRRFVDRTLTVDWPRSRHGNTYVDCACDLNHPLPFADGQFDTIVMSDVLEHVAEPLTLCSETSRILRPGGSLLLNVPFLYWLHERPHDYYRYTEYGLRHLLQAGGLHIVVMKAIGGSPEVLADLIAKHLAVAPLVGKAMAVAVQHAALCFVRVGIGRRASERSSALFPLGYFVVARK